MGLSFPPSPATLLSLLLLSLLATSVSSSDYTTLVYKGCADQKFQDPTGVYSQTLKALFKTLVSQSSAAKFNKTTSGEAQSAITGLFQCRGDLSNDDCSSCVSKIPDLSRKLCDSTIAARFQLTGCYMRYEVSGFNQVSGTELLYKVCGSTRASGAGFEDRLGSALGEVEKGVAGGGNGFYTGSYQSVFVLGQCEGDLGSGDCVDCVKSAVDRAKSDCGTSISGQVYLQMCYISYTYYPNGVPSKSPSGGGTKGNTQKTVAIVVGVLAGFGLGIACLMVLKSACKKREGGD
ncbi:plasmodesmata-located protein 2-like isoform X2 [Rhododendron vialii]|uniref:plasmodesmata-located protein 2-like isoform X2 n=1 Tax=Rhododendron vialii TaxID=182163 RepID=UPI00265F347C|nr:plasmodesmata-located protein 2-like isoform X2 [Rhododendron vialii]